jgi:hypothetical protein
MAEPWPVAEKQRRLITQYASRITWHIRDGFEAWLLRYRLTSVERIEDWHTAQRIVNALQAMCMAEHKCKACKQPCRQAVEK